MKGDTSWDLSCPWMARRKPPCEQATMSMHALSLITVGGARSSLEMSTILNLRTSSYQAGLPRDKAGRQRPLGELSLYLVVQSTRKAGKA